MAGMLQLMNMDDGGRRVENMGLQCGSQSPEHAAFTRMGTMNHSESLLRHSAEEHDADDKRRERQKHGHVPFRLEGRVPDVGGLAWRTKSGQMLKNQNFYSQKSKVNKWDDPTFAGINTWKQWHGPKQRTNADTMERLDKFDAEAAEWEAKKTFVNTTRAETLDRFYNQKLNRTQREAAGSWAPQRRARSEVNSIFETFDARLDERPIKELKKVLTPFVLKRDREAMRMIAARLQNEETWKQVFQDIEQERRADIRADLQLRQAHNDRLMLLSGAPVMERSEQDRLQPVSVSGEMSMRVDELSQKPARMQAKAMHQDVSKMTDFRGLIHADNEHALEVLFPGSGHELKTEFCQRIARSTEPGWPGPPRAATPAHGKNKGSRDLEARSEDVAMASIPTSPHRLSNVGSRRHARMLGRHAKAQFQSTVAPPPLDQSETLLGEDWSKSTVLAGGRSRVTGSFSRTSHTNNTKSMGDLPPPRRSLVYPVLAPTSPHNRAPLDVSHMSSMAPLTPISRSTSMPALKQASTRSRGAAGAVKTAELCEELDIWEATASKVPGIDNFFGPPRATRHLYGE